MGLGGVLTFLVRIPDPMTFASLDYSFLGGLGGQGGDGNGGLHLTHSYLSLGISASGFVGPSGDAAKLWPGPVPTIQRTPIRDFCDKHGIDAITLNLLFEEEFENANGLFYLTIRDLKNAGLKRGQIAELQRAMQEFVSESQTQRQGTPQSDTQITDRVESVAPIPDSLSDTESIAGREAGRQGRKDGLIVAQVSMRKTCNAFTIRFSNGAMLFKWCESLEINRQYFLHLIWSDSAKK